MNRPDLDRYLDSARDENNALCESSSGIWTGGSGASAIATSRRVAEVALPAVFLHRDS